MKQTCFVGFDTSNYTTSVAVCDLDGNVLLNAKRLLSVSLGERGLRQSDALFAHVKNLPELSKALKDAIKDYTVAGVGCSTRPRNAEGSYMPCFLAGKNAAFAFAAGLGLPVQAFSHQEGHLMAAAYSSGRAEQLLTAPFAAFHVSGGTTEVLYVSPTQEGFSIELLGGTADLNAGQAIDRIGVLMGLSFPAGKEMEALAESYTGELPPLKVSVKEGICNLSGLENLAADLWKKTQDRAAVAKFVFAYLAKSLAKLTDFVDKRYPGIPILYAGGVMSNRFLQSELAKRPNTCFAEPAFSSDNAAGIALLTRRKLLQS